MVVMLLGLYAGVRQMFDFDLEPRFLANCLYHLRQLQHVKLFGELIENTKFTGLSGIETCDVDATDRVSNVQKPSRLTPFSIDG